ncbi:SLAP domain-containing protein [Lactobacillus apis]|uniref:SLAP domain-containing protein n=1 Tax=Lactobacillus apis TaxID=303541 RepID=UPI00243036EE|nr:SLAP domain-containing protein [Lactobacillus apis]
MRKSKCRQALTALVAITSLGSCLALNAEPSEAKTVTGRTELTVPAAKIGRITKKTSLYNGKGRKIKKSTLKKGEKLALVGKVKINKKKYYRVGYNKYVLAKYVTIIKPTPQQDTTNPSTSTPITPTTPKTPSKSEDDAVSNFSISDFRKAFLDGLNAERADRGLSPVTEDSHYDEVVQERTKLLPNNFSHFDSNNKFILEKCFEDANIKSASVAECIAMFPWGASVDHSTNELVQEKNASSALVAQGMLYEYIYNDAASNWGHRDILLNPKTRQLVWVQLSDKVIKFIHL